MKWLDEKGRIFGKINIFDLIVLLALVLGVAFILLRPAAGENGEEIEYQSAVFTLKIEGVRDYVVGAYQVGDIIYEGSTEIGTVREIKAAPQKVVKLQPDGSYKEVERKLYYDVELILETDDYYEDEGQFIDGKGMLSGTTHAITNGIVNNDATVRSIQGGEIYE